MPDVDWWAYALAACVISAAILQFLLLRRRSYRNYLEPDVARQGFTLVSVRVPGLLERGPFPWFQILPEKRSLSILGVSGQYEAYRAVTFRDTHGILREAWAMLVFQAFSLAWVKWKPSLDEFAPPVSKPEDQDRPAT